MEALLLATRPHGLSRWRQLIGLSLLALATTMCVAPAPAQDLPAERIAIVTAFPAETPSDLAVRTLAVKLAAQLRLRVDVVNRPDSTDDPAQEGVAAAEEVLRATADGSTLLLGTASTMALAPALNRAAPFDPEADFVPVCLVAAYPFIVALHPDVPAKNLAELIVYVRTRQGLVALGSGSGAAHLATNDFARMTGATFRHERYGSNSTRLAKELLEGRIQIAFDNMVLPLVKVGRLRAIAVTSQLRLPALPDVPTMSEAGLPGFEASGWIALFAPKGTPRATANRLASEIAKAMGDRETAGSFATRGFIVRTGTPEQLQSFLRDERARLARAAGTTVGSP